MAKSKSYIGLVLIPGHWGKFMGLSHHNQTDLIASAPTKSALKDMLAQRGAGEVDATYMTNRTRVNDQARVVTLMTKAGLLGPGVEAVYFTKGVIQDTVLFRLTPEGGLVNVGHWVYDRQSGQMSLDLTKEA